MAESATVARPYAKAAYEIAQGKKKESEWLGSLETLAVLVENDKVRANLTRPDMDAAKQGEFLLGLAEESASDGELRNFVAVLAANDRLFLLPQIAEQFRLLTLSGNSIVKARIFTPYKLTGEQIDSIVAAFRDKRGVSIDPEVVIDEDLIGGVKIEYGDRVLDLSIRNRLAQLYATMLN